MDIELRPVREGELEEMARVDHVAFGSAPPDPERLAELRRAIELDRTRAVFDGGRIVAASAAYSFELTLPGLTTVPAAGVTWVGVLPTHRRRGHLTRMMAALLDDAADRAEPVAMLLASEGTIYGRFGYGVATSHTSVEIESRHGALRPSAPGGDGRVELLGAEQAAKVFPGVLDAARRRQPGDVRRPDPFWDGLFRDPENRRDGASPLFHVVHESAAGEADGYAVYRVKPAWDGAAPKSRILLREVVGLSPAAEADLWRYLFSIDLTEVVEADLRPLDDPLRWMLVDPRRLRVREVGDYVWVRLLDVAAGLAARRYAAAGSLVLEVADAFRPAGTASTVGPTGPPAGVPPRRPTSPSAPRNWVRCTWAVWPPHPWPPPAASPNADPAPWPRPTPCSPPTRPPSATPTSDGSAGLDARQLGSEPQPPAGATGAPARVRRRGGRGVEHPLRLAAGEAEAPVPGRLGGLRPPGRGPPGPGRNARIVVGPHQDRDGRGRVGVPGHRAQLEQPRGHRAQATLLLTRGRSAPATGPVAQDAVGHAKPQRPLVDIPRADLASAAGSGLPSRFDDIVQLRRRDGARPQMCDLPSGPVRFPAGHDDPPVGVERDQRRGRRVGPEAPFGPHLQDQGVRSGRYRCPVVA